MAHNRVTYPGCTGAAVLQPLEKQVHILWVPVPAPPVPVLPFLGHESPVEAGSVARHMRAAGGKLTAIHNLCSTPASSCLANVKHCLGLFWALYFCTGCFKLGEGHRERFLIASILKNTALRRKAQGRSLVTRPQTMEFPRASRTPEMFHRVGTWR